MMKIGANDRKSRGESKAKRLRVVSDAFFSVEKYRGAGGVR